MLLKSQICQNNSHRTFTIKAAITQVTCQESGVCNTASDPPVLCVALTEPKTQYPLSPHLIGKLKWPKGGRNTVVFRVFDANYVGAKTKIVVSLKSVIPSVVK